MVKYNRRGGILEWKYVKAHSGNYGNDNADRLAKWAAEATHQFSQINSSKCPSVIAHYWLYGHIKGFIDVN